MSLTDPTLASALGTTSITGTATATGATEGLASELEAEPELELELLVTPDTAEDTVWETKGLICATTWETMSSFGGWLTACTATGLTDWTGLTGRTGRMGRAGRLVPVTADVTVWEIRGWTWETTLDTISSVLKVDDPNAWDCDCPALEPKEVDWDCPALDPKELDWDWPALEPKEVDCD